MRPRLRFSIHTIRSGEQRTIMDIVIVFLPSCYVLAVPANVQIPQFWWQFVVFCRLIQTSVKEKMILTSDKMQFHSLMKSKWTNLQILEKVATFLVRSRFDFFQLGSHCTLIYVGKSVLFCSFCCVVDIFLKWLNVMTVASAHLDYDWHCLALCVKPCNVAVCRESNINAA